MKNRLLISILYGRLRTFTGSFPTRTKVFQIIIEKPSSYKSKPIIAQLILRVFLLRIVRLHRDNQNGNTR